MACSNTVFMGCRMQNVFEQAISGERDDAEPRSTVDYPKLLIWVASLVGSWGVVGLLARTVLSAIR